MKHVPQDRWNGHSWTRPENRSSLQWAGRGNIAEVTVGEALVAAFGVVVVVAAAAAAATHRAGTFESDGKLQYLDFEGEP
jgi:hypothetical protein